MRSSGHARCPRPAGTGCRGASASASAASRSAKPRACARRRARPTTARRRRGSRASRTGTRARTSAGRLRDRRRQTPWKPSQPAITSQSSSCRRRRADDARASRSRPRRRPSRTGAAARVEPRGDQILDHLRLAVDDDRPAAGELAHRHVVALAVELEVDAVVDDPLAVQTLADSGARAGRRCPARARRRGRAPRRSRGSGSRARPTRSRRRCSSCASVSPAGPRADDADLRPHSSSTLRDRERAVRGRHAAVDRGLEQHLFDLVRSQAVPQRGADVHRELVVVVERRRAPSA